MSLKVHSRVEKRSSFFFAAASRIFSSRILWLSCCHNISLLWVELHGAIGVAYLSQWIFKCFFLKVSKTIWLCSLSTGRSNQLLVFKLQCKAMWAMSRAEARYAIWMKGVSDDPGNLIANNFQLSFLFLCVFVEMFTYTRDFYQQIKSRILCIKTYVYDAPEKKKQRNEPRLRFASFFCLLLYLKASFFLCFCLCQILLKFDNIFSLIQLRDLCAACGCETKCRQVF